jgi:hypothetical protein
MAKRGSKSGGKGGKGGKGKRGAKKGKLSFFEVPDSMIEYLPAFDAERFAMNWPKLVASIAARF